MMKSGREPDATAPMAAARRLEGEERRRRWEEGRFSGEREGVRCVFKEEKGEGRVWFGEIRGFSDDL